MPRKTPGSGSGSARGGKDSKEARPPQDASNVEGAPDPTDPAEWLRRARSNLIRARARLPGVYLEDLCFDAQQAAEKAIKAVLIARAVTFPYVHDLADLLTLAMRDGTDVPGDVMEAARLTRYAVASRYPGVVEPVTAEEHEAAVAVAEAVVRWAEVEARGVT
jgi:HEPN domain-containing protein